MFKIIELLGDKIASIAKGSCKRSLKCFSRFRCRHLGVYIVLHRNEKEIQDYIVDGSPEEIEKMMGDAQFIEECSYDELSDEDKKTADQMFEDIYS